MKRLHGRVLIHARRANAPAAEDYERTRMPPALEQILDIVRVSLRARHADTVERSDRIRAALDVYVSAIAHEIAAEFATKNGLTPPPAGMSPIGAALALRAAVEALPELRSRHSVGEHVLTPSRPMPSAPTPIVEHVVTRHVPVAPPSSPWRAAEHEETATPPHAAPAAPPAPARRPAELDPVANALIRDVQQLDLARMPSHQFRVWAEELAARARALQDKGADPDEVPGRVIRKLTAIAYEKGIGDIFGLNRKHSANWDEVADRAKIRREASLANASAAAERADKLAAEKLAAEKEASVQRAAAERAAAVEKALARAAAAELVKKGEKEKEKEREKDKDKPKAAPVAEEPVSEKPAKEKEPSAKSSREKAAAAAAAEEADPQSGKRELPMLRSAAKRSPVVFVGGVVKQEKVALIIQKHGVEVEWIDTSRHGTQAISGLEKRIRERRLAAVVVLQGLIGHKHFEPIVAAARQVGCPFAYADKAGLGSVVRAFNELEKQITDGSAAERAV